MRYDRFIANGEDIDDVALGQYEHAQGIVNNAMSMISAQGSWADQGDFYSIKENLKQTFRNMPPGSGGTGSTDILYLAPDGINFVMTPEQLEFWVQYPIPER